MRVPVSPRPCTPGGSARSGEWWPARWTAMLELGAHADDISALLGPAVSGRNYEVPAAMADEVEAALPGSRTTTDSRNARPRPSGRNRLPAKEIWASPRSTSIRAARWPTVPVQPSPGRADRAAGVAGLDGVTAMAVGMSDSGSGQGDRETELTHALAAVRSRLAMAAEAAGRNVGEIELLPITKFFPATDVAILSRLGCRSVGESREQEAAAKVAELTRLAAASEASGDPILESCSGTWWDRFSVRRRVRWPAGRTPRIRSTAHNW